MIRTAELSAWLEDPERQRASFQSASALGRRWSGHPLFREFEAEFNALEPRTGATVLAAAERFMARTDDIGELLRDMIRAAAEDPFFYPPFLYTNSGIGAAFLLFYDPSLTIGLGVTSIDALAAKKTNETGPSSINFTGLLSSFHWIKGGNATLSFWEAPAADHGFSGSTAGKCRFVERRTLRDGDHFVMDGSRQSFVVEHATSDMVCLQATVGTDSAPLLVEYDSRTLEFVGAASSDEAASRIEMMVSLLRLMDREDAVPEIVALLDTPHFYTRWHVMRELLALDAEAALPHLRHMAERDPHPEVRAAARHTLDLFFDAQEEAA